MLFAFCFTLFSDDSESFDFSDMSLQAITHLEVEVASKRLEKVSDAPGSITLYTSEDIKKLGYFTIANLADITPGYSTFMQYGERGLETRGLKADPWNNNKHLLVIDGIPIRHIRANKALVDEQMPIFYADKVEFLRGPASALYGVGAFHGVINVVNTPLENEGFQVQNSFSYGTENQKWRNYASVQGKSSAGTFQGAFSIFQKDASRTPIDVTDSTNIHYYDDDQSIFFRSAFSFDTPLLKGLSAGFIYSKKRGGIGEFWTETENYEGANVVWETSVPYVKVEKNIGDKVSLNSYFQVTSSSENGYALYKNIIDTVILNGDTLYINQKNDTLIANDSIVIGDDIMLIHPTTMVNEYNDELRSYEGLIEADWSISRNIAVIAGVNILSRKKLGAKNNTYYWSTVANHIGSPIESGGVFEVESPYSHTLSGYVQVQNRFPLLEGLSTIAGLREDYGIYGEQRYSQLSPRLGVVQRITDKLNIKVLYGAALKAPGLKEFGIMEELKVSLVEEGMSQELPELDAERAQTIEAAVLYTARRGALGITLFQNKVSNALESYTIPGVSGRTYTSFRNSSDTTSAQGLEIDGSLQLFNSLKLFGNYSFAMSENSSGVAIQDVPTHKVNGGIVHTFEKRVSLSNALIAKWIDGYRINDQQHTTSRFLMDYTFSMGVSDNISVGVQVTNITDNEYWQPIQGIERIPFPGREFLFTGTVSF